MGVTVTSTLPHTCSPTLALTMPEYPLAVAIIWHMHQPFYRDLRTGQIPLPWVRLHAAKDYLHMAEVLARHPEMHLTINMVPSLTDQMLAWAEGREADDLVLLAEQTEWSLEDKREILNLAFSISWDKVIRRYPRYAELLDRRPQALADPDAFSDADYRDLLAWFNLAWFDPTWLAQNAYLTGLVARGRDFTLTDQRAIHAIQRQVAARVLPAYRELAARGQLEITTTPYYHPVLPLLADTGFARRASPDLPLPEPPFNAPEDAARQLQMAVAAHTAHFGEPPSGLWPSEGAVAPEVLPLVTAAGFQWLATDEAILGRSLGRPFVRDGSNMITDPRALYQVYRVLAGSEIGPFILFRDHELSDRVGFLYQGLPGAQAAADLIYRLLEIRRRLNDSSVPYLVSIILDGENCWEHYERNGDTFLDALYAQLPKRPELKPVTVREFLGRPTSGRRPAATLAKLATGSWIGGDLTTWIGDPEHNRAWEALRRTRAHLVAAQARADAGDSSQPTGAHAERELPADHAAGPDFQRAWQALYAAEGSDWFWWYSHRNTSQQDALFDRLFRHNLAAIYEALGDEPPAWLVQPINQPPIAGCCRDATAYITPRLIGSPYPGEAWAPAAVVQPAQASTGTMQRAEGMIERLLVGHDARDLYLRLDLRDRLDAYQVSIYLGGPVTGPTVQRARGRYPDPDLAPSNLAATWEIQRQPGQSTPFRYRAAGQDSWASVAPVLAAAGENVLEISVPLEALGLTLGSALNVLVTLVQGDVIVAQLPEREVGTVTLHRF